MRNRSKIILAALAATMLFSLAVSTASANRLSVTEKNFEAIWDSNLGGVKSDLLFADSGGHTVKCKVTLLGSFTNNTIKKEITVNQGQVNHATLGSCSTGAATILTETLPWPIRYRNFGGTLPNAISDITLGVLKVSVQAEINGVRCLAVTESGHPASVIIETPSRVAENITPDPTRTIELGGFVCSFVSPARFEGVGLVRNLPGTSKLTITLI